MIASEGLASWNSSILTVSEIYVNLWNTSNVKSGKQQHICQKVKERRVGTDNERYTENAEAAMEMFSSLRLKLFL